MKNAPIDLTLSDIKEIIRLYQDEGLGFRPIAERFGCGKTKILNIIRVRGLTKPVGQPAKTKEFRFWNLVDQAGATDCWNWLGARTTFGHGMFEATVDLNSNGYDCSNAL